MIIYIAGPFRASTPWEIEQNIRKAEGWALEVAKLGYIPLCPHSMYRFFQASLPDEFWLKAGIELLDMCDGILMTPGWENSSGSRAEKEYAEKTKGMYVYISFDALKCGLPEKQKERKLER